MIIILLVAVDIIFYIDIMIGKVGYFCWYKFVYLGNKRVEFRKMSWWFGEGLGRVFVGMWIY